MILKNIELPAITIANLYKHSLVDIRNFFGSNKKNILFLVNIVDARFLPFDQLTFLAEILSACKLGMDDIAIVNLNNRDTPDFKPVADILKSAIIIASGIELSVLELPFKIPSFQVQLYKEKKYVHIPLLRTIQNDPVLKRKLWELLKVLFLI